MFKAFSSKASSSIIGEGDSGGESPNEEDMVLFMKRFNRYIKNHGLIIATKTLEGHKQKERIVNMKMA